MPLLGQLDTQVSKPDMRKCEEQYLAIFRCLNASGHGTMFKSDWNYLQQVLNDALGTGKDGGDTCVGRNEYEVNTFDMRLIAAISLSKCSNEQKIVKQC